jgi:hypothetical protein
MYRTVALAGFRLYVLMYPRKIMVLEIFYLNYSTEHTQKRHLRAHTNIYAEATRVHATVLPFSEDAYIRRKN